MTDAARTRWTDERIDDLARRVEIHDTWGGEVAGLGTAVGQIEVHLADLGENLGELREDVRELRREVRHDVGELRRWLVNLWATVGLGIAGLLVEIAVR
jgi:hypothetical protein